MKNTSLIVSGVLLAAVAGQVAAETIVLREVSLRTYSSTLNDEKNNPVLVIDDLKKPHPIGPGRGAGGWVFLNNKVTDWKTNKDMGMMRGWCMTVDHGPNGPFKGEVVIGQGGPYDAACQITYLLPGGQINANGNMNLTALEQDNTLALGVNGGTGKYAGIRGEVKFTQDPPGQPIVYKVTITYKK